MSRRRWYMVQVSLRTAGCLAGLLALALLAGAFLVLFTDVGRHEHAENVRRRPDPLDVEDLRRLSPPEHTVALVPAQKAELEGIYADIVQAYSNRQVEVLREWRRKLPGMVESVRRDDLDGVELPFSLVLYNEVIPELGRKKDSRSILATYGSVGDFELSLGAMLAFSGIYGDVRLRRKEFGGRLDDLEALVVYRLVSYRDCFRAAGRTEMEKSAGRLLAEWIDQIESENCYTKARLVHDIACIRVQGDNLMENCGQTWNAMSQNFVRMATYGLIHAGYTPKWLEEFANIPRHAAPSAKEPGK